MDSELGPSEEAPAAMNPTDVLTCRLVVLGRVSRHPRDLSFYTARRRTGSMDRWQAAGGRDESRWMGSASFRFCAGPIASPVITLATVGYFCHAGDRIVKGRFVLTTGGT